MSLFSPIIMLVSARTLARDRKSVSNLAYLTEKSRGVPALSTAWSWDSNGTIRPWSLSLSLRLISPSSSVAPLSDKLTPHGGKMAATASACIPPGLSPAGKNVAYISVDPAQTWEFNLTTPVQIIAHHFPDYWQGWAHFIFMVFISLKGIKIIILLKTFTFIMHDMRRAYIFTLGGVPDVPKLEAPPLWAQDLLSDDLSVSWSILLKIITSWWPYPCSAPSEKLKPQQCPNPFISHTLHPQVPAWHPLGSWGC